MPLIMDPAALCVWVGVPHKFIAWSWRSFLQNLEAFVQMVWAWIDSIRIFWVQNDLFLVTTTAILLPFLI